MLQTPVVMFKPVHVELGLLLLWYPVTQVSKATLPSLREKLLASSEFAGVSGFVSQYAIITVPSNKKFITKTTDVQVRLFYVFKVLN